MSTSDGYVPGRVERDYIESLGRAARSGARWRSSRPPSPTTCRSSTATAAGCWPPWPPTGRRIVEVGTAFGYSTLWMALAQPPGRHDRDDRPGPRADRSAPGAGGARLASPTGGSPVVNRPALEAFAAGAAEPALAGPFDLVFIDALKHEYLAYLDALWPRLGPGARDRRRQRAVERLGDRSRLDPLEAPTDLRAFNAAVLADPRFVATILPVGDGLLSRRSAGEADRPAMVNRVRVRLFAMQRELAGTRQVDLELAEGASIEAAWAALVGAHPALAPGRSAVRFARNGVYADPTEILADGDELACIPPVSGGAQGPAAADHRAARRAVRARDPGRARRPPGDRRRRRDLRFPRPDPVDPRDAGPGPGGGGGPPCRAAGRGARLRGPRVDGRPHPGGDRRRGPGPLRRRADRDRPSPGDRCRWAR